MGRHTRGRFAPGSRTSDLAEADRKIGALQQFRADLQGHIDRFEPWLAENADR